MSIKISELPAAGAAIGPMELEVNDAGTSRKVTSNQMRDYVIAAPIPPREIGAAESVGSTYTLIPSDVGKMLVSTRSDISFHNFTLPDPDSDIDFPPGSWVTILQEGTAAVFVFVPVGINLQAPQSFTESFGRYSVITLYKLALNEWRLFGDLSG